VVVLLLGALASLLLYGRSAHYKFEHLRRSRYDRGSKLSSQSSWQ